MEDLKFNVLWDEELEQPSVEEVSEWTVSLDLWEEQETKEEVSEEDTNNETKEDDTKEDDTKGDLDNSDWESLDTELEELESLLSDIDKDTKENSEAWDNSRNEELSEKVSKSIKEINKLRDKIADLELEKAEKIKFGEESTLDPSLTIINSIYMKAKEWDEESLSKFMKLVLEDLSLDLHKPKDVFVNSSISSNTSVNTEEADDWTYWFNIS